MSEIPDGFVPPAKEAANIRPSASLVATRDGPNGIEILFCHRVPQMPSFPDFWAFPGGGVTRFDHAAAEALIGFSNDDRGAGLACLMREMVEEVGWAPASDGIIEVGSEIRAKVVNDGKKWHPLAEVGSLPADTSRFSLITTRTTPPLSPMRFANQFFHLHDPSPPEPTLPDGRSEFDDMCWLTPDAALAAWEKSEMRIPPPLITLLRDLISALKEAKNGSIDEAVSILATNPPKGSHRIEFAPGVECIPVPTNTLPPATHTNCYILGNPGGEHVVVDPAPHTNDGLEFLKQKIRVVENAGGHIIATIFTHRHLDHIGNLEEISKIYQAPIWASAETLEAIPYSNENRALVDGDEFTLSGDNWYVLDTPGHCPGHICLSGEVGIISGDMAVMIGTILVPPNDGDMAQYIASLEKIRDLKPPMLFPSHGPLSPVPERLLNHYITHRKSRHARVLDAINNGINEISTIADYAYEDTPNAHPILKVDQTLSHLHTHERDGNVKQIQGNWHLAD